MNNRCPRCKSAMVTERFWDVTGESFIGQRCVWCGEIVDSTILKNRLFSQQLHDRKPTEDETDTSIQRCPPRDLFLLPAKDLASRYGYHSITIYRERYRRIDEGEVAEYMIRAWKRRRNGKIRKRFYGEVGQPVEGRTFDSGEMMEVGA